MSMRVLLVNDFYAPHMVGGAATLVQEMALGLLARGHDVAVVTARTAGSGASDAIGGVPILRIGQFPTFSRALLTASGTAPGRLAEETGSDFRSLVGSFRPDV